VLELISQGIREKAHCCLALKRGKIFIKLPKEHNESAENYI
jgi:hypothetical protein